MLPFLNFPFASMLLRSLGLSDISASSVLTEISVVLVPKGLAKGSGSVVAISFEA